MIIRQLEKMRMELEENQKLVFSLEDDLHLEHSRAQSLHNSLVHEISLSLQGRDAALIALKNLEIFCKENNFPIGNHAGIYEVVLLVIFTIFILVVTDVLWLGFEKSLCSG